MKNKEEKFSGYIIAAMCFIFIFVSMGVLNSLGVFMPAIAAANGFKTSQVSLMFSFAGIGAALTGMFITPKALKKFGEKKCMLISAALTTFHAVTYSLINSLVLFYVVAFIAGIAIGIGIYAACCSIIGNWFIKNRLTLLGIISAGSSTGSAVINMLAGSLITGVGYKNAYLVLAAIIAVFGFSISLLIKNRPEDVGQRPLPDDLEAVGTVTIEDNEAVMEFGEIKKTPSFILGFIGAIVGYIGFCGVNIYNVTLLSTNYELGVDVATRYDAVLRVSLAVILFFAGKVAEKVRTRTYIICAGALFLVGLLIMIATGKGITAMPALLVVAMILLAVGGTMTNANNQIMANTLFGTKAYGFIQPYYVAAGNIGLAAAAFVCAPFIGADGSVIGCFKLAFGCIVAWLIIEVLAITMSPYLKNKKR